jgi:hypothetical protein
MRRGIPRGEARNLFVRHYTAAQPCALAGAENLREG